MTTTMIAELDQLERKIQAAAKLLDQLREEKRSLVRENRELKERVRALENSVGREKSPDWKPRLHALEQERTSLLDERRAMARRVEEMLVKLSVLEKAVHA
jgi:predicted  nucleic acid-binding Zn-ribbon protein